MNVKIIIYIWDTFIYIPQLKLSIVTRVDSVSLLNGKSLYSNTKHAGKINIMLRGAI